MKKLASLIFAFALAVALSVPLFAQQPAAPAGGQDAPKAEAGQTQKQDKKAKKDKKDKKDKEEGKKEGSQNPPSK